MKTKPFFSIVMPIYNAESYLTEAIESVLHQTCQDFELILVNDASTDQSEMICQEFVASHQEKVRLYSHPENKGLLLTRATGMEEVRGQYCLCMDADDVLRVDYLELVKQTIDETQAEAVVINFSMEADFSIKRRDFSPFLNRQMTGLEVIEELLLAKTQLTTVWQLVFKAYFIPDQAFYQQFGHFVRSVDRITLHHILARAERAIVLDEALYYYRQVETSLSHSFNLTNFEVYAQTDLYLYHIYYKKFPEKMDAYLVRRFLWYTKKVLLKSKSFKEVCDRARVIRQSLVFRKVIEMKKDMLSQYDRLFLLLLKYRILHILLAINWYSKRLRRLL
ncbi:glycosyltransferase family 2 protein [Streptococcus suis]|uniref:glycosyltransferase family 2 protein n=1 Tax=Streptococcus suis TaxID=1307 RepID=UPI001C979FA8|nr:glycosyltransferase family 2 protein [Streptococcus suis]MBY5025117.1 glycosyltransferase family 2 protein [Streptococcus suis]QZT18323.1 glycosyltransferase family 2 protein [Streptococcus suis]